MSDKAETAKITHQDVFVAYADHEDMHEIQAFFDKKEAQAFVSERDCAFFASLTNAVVVEINGKKYILGSDIK